MYLANQCEKVSVGVTDMQEAILLSCDKNSILDPHGFIMSLKYHIFVISIKSQVLSKMFEHYV